MTLTHKDCNYPCAILPIQLKKMKALIFVISFAILSSIMGCSHQYMNQKTITKDNDLSKKLRLEKELLYQYMTL